MQLINKTQTQLDISALESRVENTISSLRVTATQLNHAYDCVWSLPDNRLQSLLQALVDANKFQEIFSLHAQSAASINTLLVAAGDTALAKEGAGRDYTIKNGVITIIPLPEPPIEDRIPIDNI